MAEYKFKRDQFAIQKEAGGQEVVTGMRCGDYGLTKTEKRYAVVHIPSKKVLTFMPSNASARLYAGKMNDQDWDLSQGLDVLREYHVKAYAYATRQE